MARLLFLFLFPLALFGNNGSPPVLGYQVLPFHDPHSDTDRELLVWYPVDASAAGKPSSTPWDVFYIAANAPPATQKEKRPVIIISHGYTGNPHQLSWLIKGLVNANFVVMSIEHRDHIKGKVHINHWQRARDISTIIDVLSSSTMKKYVDLNKIGIAGFSLGGTTAIWLAGGRATKLKTLIPSAEYASPGDWDQADEALPTLDKEQMAKSWQEPRVKAAFIMAPAWSWLFDEKSLSEITIPTYFIAAENDKVLVTANNAGYFARNIPHSIFKKIPGKSDHFIFVTKLDPEQRKKADPNEELTILFHDDPSVDRHWIQAQVINDAVGFFKRYL